MQTTVFSKGGICWLLNDYFCSYNQRFMDISLQDVQGALTFISMIAFLWLLVEFKGMKEAIKDRLGINNEALKMQLQAYERLSVFSERCGLRSLVTRLQEGGESAAMLHSAIVEAIKSEYDYNVSQQIYVTPEIWNAVTKLRDQNIYVINQLAAGLGGGSTGLDLAKRVIEYSMTPNAELNVIVKDALQFEAKKLLKNN
jgi:hypothetical protein